jgi:hypothetical protein
MNRARESGGKADPTADVVLAGSACAERGAGISSIRRSLGLTEEELAASQARSSRATTEAR